MLKIDIIQQAVLLIGNNPGNTTNSTLDNKLANRAFDNVTTDLMQQTPWDFAYKVFDLSKLSETIPFVDYANVFQLPVDFFAVNTTKMNNNYVSNCSDYTTYPTENSFLIVGSKYYSSAETVKLYYYTDVENNLSGSNFDQALIFALASRIALAVTKDKELAKDMRELSENRIAQAIDQNSLTNKQSTVLYFDGFNAG